MLRAALIATTLATLGCGGAHRDRVGQPAGDDVGRTIDSVLAAYGGEQALDQVTSYTMRGRIENTAHGGGATTFRTFQRPDRLKVVVHYPTTVEVRILDGTRGWRREASGTYEEAEGPALDAMTLQAARANVPWILAARRADIRAIPALEQKGYTYPGLALALGDGLELRVYVDRQTHLPAVTESVMRTGDLTTSFRTIYADYRPVGGVLFAFREENFASGQHTGSTFLSDVTVNPELGPTTFSPGQ
jgi:hypothetical protein